MSENLIVNTEEITDKEKLSIVLEFLNNAEKENVIGVDTTYELKDFAKYLWL